MFTRCPVEIVNKIFIMIRSPYREMYKTPLSALTPHPLQFLPYHAYHCLHRAHILHTPPRSSNGRTGTGRQRACHPYIIDKAKITPNTKIKQENHVPGLLLWGAHNFHSLFFGQDAMGLLDVIHKNTNSSHTSLCLRLLAFLSFGKAQLLLLKLKLAGQ